MTAACRAFRLRFIVDGLSETVVVSTKGIMDTTPEQSRGWGRAKASVLATTGASYVILTPVDRRNLTSDDSNSTAGVPGIFPNVIVTGTQPRKDRGEDWLVLNSSFQDLDMDALRDVA